MYMANLVINCLPQYRLLTFKLYIPGPLSLCVSVFFVMDMLHEVHKKVHAFLIHYIENSWKVMDVYLCMAGTGHIHLWWLTGKVGSYC